MSAASPLEARLRGTRASAVREEFLSNSAYFPLANILFEWLREGWSAFLRSPDPYTLLATGLVQAWFLGSWKHAGRPRPFLGNLIGPAFYTAVEGLIEGPGFFRAPHHLAYWAFSLAIGAAQEVRLRAGDDRVRVAATIAENVLRAAIIVVMYAIFEALSNPADASLAGFFADASHGYVTASLLALGAVIGVAQVTSDGYLALLRSTASQLRRYSELAMGRRVLERAVEDETSLAPTRHDRTVVFLDIRGFTAWSERQSPEEVVRMLNAFYETTEKAVAPFWPIRIKYTADEALLVFAEPAPAVAAARALREALAPQLAAFGLSAGFGIHAGPVIEGLLGSESVKAFDVLGDTVNAAKRLCDGAAGGEILATEAIPAVGAGDAPVRELRVKGKSEPLRVRALASP
ncbi:MAG: adenylate/guanylate cyclase domain-containing protein [Betaproteobacteria bacterium]|nr:adenylate/guanylate cyclase domain-containing protein [Betaproteobacteria bacterium]